MPDQDVRGKSVLDLLWEKLDQYVDKFQELNEYTDQREWENLAEAKGRAHAAAVCVALVTNPYHPDVDVVKTDAMERWELRQGVSDHQEKLVRKTVRTHNERTTSMTDDERARRREQRRARRAARNG